MNRIEAIKEDLESTNDPEDQMLMIMDALKDTVTPIPDIGKFYTFVYNAKTPQLQYDQHPLIACTHLERWGFKGINYHWQQTRNYTWEELAGNLYIVEWNELDDLLAVPYAKYILNRSTQRLGKLRYGMKNSVRIER
jgi:hypothetical protein